MNNCYILLSEKKWNKELFHKLKNKFIDSRWVFLDEKEDFNYENLLKLDPVKIFIPHWSDIIPSKIFSNFDCVVFHMTDLPFGRGGSPLQNLIYRGKKTTQISALRVVKELDAGPIFLKKKLSLLGTAEEIFIRANLIIERMIFDILSGDLEPEEQEGIPIVFKRRVPEMSKVDNTITTTEALYDQIRMLDAEGYPNAFIETEFFKFEFTRASLKTGEKIIADVRITKK